MARCAGRRASDARWVTTTGEAGGAAGRAPAMGGLVPPHGAFPRRRPRRQRFDSPHARPQRAYARRRRSPPTRAARRRCCSRSRARLPSPPPLPPPPLPPPPVGDPGGPPPCGGSPPTCVVRRAPAWQRPHWWGGRATLATLGRPTQRATPGVVGALARRALFAFFAAFLFGAHRFPPLGHPAARRRARPGPALGAPGAAAPRSSRPSCRAH